MLIPSLACLRLSLFVRRLVLGSAGQSESPGLTLGGLGRSCRAGGSTEAPAKAPGAAPCPRTHARRCWGPFPAQEVGSGPFVNSRVDAAGLRGELLSPRGSSSLGVKTRQMTLGRGRSSLTSRTVAEATRKHSL